MGQIGAAWLRDSLVQNMDPALSGEAQTQLVVSLHRIWEDAHHLSRPMDLYAVALALRQARLEQLQLQQVQQDLSELLRQGMFLSGAQHMGFARVGFASLAADGTLTFSPTGS